MFRKTLPGLPARTSMLFQLTAVHSVIISIILIISSYLIYTTACALVDQMPAGQTADGGAAFREELAVFLWALIPLTIIAGAFFHYFFSKKMTGPLEQLVSSMNELKNGKYPEKVSRQSFKEIDNLTDHFNELSERLRKNEAARGKMLTDMAHELRTPLSNVNGYLEALKDGVIEGDTKLYASLHNESERLIRMVEQIQEMNRWNEQTSAVMGEKERADMRDVLLETAGLFELKFRNRSITFEADADSCHLHIHREGIMRAVMNLLENAIQYYEGSGAVQLMGTYHGGDYMITVTGPGAAVPEDEPEKLFERFYRADKSRSRKTGGTGLGLAIVKDIIVQQHGGTVDVTTSQGVHTFTLVIPSDN